MILPHRVFLFSKQGQSNFLCLVQLNQFIFNLMERALCKEGSGVAQIAPSNRLLREQTDREGWGSRGREFYGKLFAGRGVAVEHVDVQPEGPG